MALERLECPAMLIERSLNKANDELRKVEISFKAYQTLSQPG
jgi:hypothetical protein